jgi:hypothetical protein
MTHEEIRQNLGAFQDGELPSGKRLEISSHLKDCAECLQAQKVWQKIAESLFQSRGFVSQKETEEFVQRAMAQITPPPAMGSFNFSNFLWKFLTPALELGFAALIFFFVLGRSEPIAAPDTLLLLGTNRDMAEWLLPPTTEQKQNWFNSVLEGQ